MIEISPYASFHDRTAELVMENVNISFCSCEELTGKHFRDAFRCLKVNSHDTKVQSFSGERISFVVSMKTRSTERKEAF